MLKTIIAVSVSASLALADDIPKTMASLPQPPGPIVALPDYSAPIPPLPTLPEDTTPTQAAHIPELNDAHGAGVIPEIVPQNPTQIASNNTPPTPVQANDQAAPSLPPLPGPTNPTQVNKTVPSPTLPAVNQSSTTPPAPPPLPGPTNPTQVNPVSPPRGPNPTTPNAPLPILPVIDKAPVAPPPQPKQPDINNLNIPINPNQVIINNPPVQSFQQPNYQNQTDNIDLDDSNFSPLVQFNNKPDILPVTDQPDNANLVPNISHPAAPPMPNLPRPEAPTSVHIADDRDQVTSPPLTNFDPKQHQINKPETMPPLENTIVESKDSKNLNREGSDNKMERIYSKDFIEKFRVSRLEYKSNKVPAELLHAQSTENSHLPIYVGGSDFTRIAFSAATKNNINTIRALIDNNKIDLDEQNADGDNLLIQALIYGSSDVARYLIAKNIDVNYVSSDGLTPLHIAVKTSNTELVNLLILKGADVNAVDKMGKKPLNYVVTSDTYIMKLLTADVIKSQIKLDI